MSDSSGPGPGGGETPRGAAFFDRDGVLNVDRGYVHRSQDVEWMPGAIEAVRAANAAGLIVVVVTNQSGVARGFYGEAEVEALHQWMSEQLAAEGARVERFYHCPFHEEAVVEAYRFADHPDRKPNPGMLRRAIAELSIDPARSFMIGDQLSDMIAGARAGVASYLFEGGDLARLTAQAIAELGLKGV
ncbi:MAG: HAD family hydrolase [Caulobacteraceae bacterium]|nr:HAD family hydrolase [Caulobacteraceae bacterium]